MKKDKGHGVSAAYFLKEGFVAVGSPGFPLFGGEAAKTIGPAQQRLRTPQGPSKLCQMKKIMNRGVGNHLFRETIAEH